MLFGPALARELLGPQLTWPSRAARDKRGVWWPPGPMSSVRGTTSFRPLLAVGSTW